MTGAMRLMILGTGAMARRHAEEFSPLPGCRIVAAADTNAERARAFAEAHGIPFAFGSLSDALAWGEFDAAVNVTPDGAHKATTLELLAAGKHVFCE
ncbi:MAG TPA: Gfo/Idh/MocA family oxidoreductase [Paracoccaceae bacterium]|nr:Gfo/Idh/MocA family oxidoreductase [Paracoccaceae bacterium]